MLGCSTDVWGVVEGFLHFFRHVCEVEPALGVVFPDGGPQHRCLGVRVEGPCFHLCVQILEVVEFLHPAPATRAWGELGLGFAFGLEGLLVGMCKLCHKKEECRENEDVVDADG